jgi:hypothetical protein
MSTTVNEPRAVRPTAALSLALLLLSAAAGKDFFFVYRLQESTL